MLEEALVGFRPGTTAIVLSKTAKGIQSQPGSLLKI
jgi:hypothetical protein